MSVKKCVPYAARRRFLATMIGAATLFPRAVPAAAEQSASGRVTDLAGEATAARETGERMLGVGSAIRVRDVVRTGDASAIAMLFGDETSIRLGERSELMIDEYLSGIRGTFDLSQGALIFDRPETAVRTPTTIMTVFGRLGVRGTRFFAGPNRDVFGVFVERGQLEVAAGGDSAMLGAGDGIDIVGTAFDGGVRQWPQDRIAEAFASVETP